MTLRGWAHPLPEWVADRVARGFIRVVEERGVELLEGEATAPSGCQVEYWDREKFRRAQEQGTYGWGHWS